MNRPHKFVTAVTAEQVAQLEALWRHGPSPRVRMRAHSLLLSTRGWSMDAIIDFQINCLTFVGLCRGALLTLPAPRWKSDA